MAVENPKKSPLTHTHIERHTLPVYFLVLYHQDANRIFFRHVIIEYVKGPTEPERAEQREREREREREPRQRDTLID